MSKDIFQVNKAGFEFDSSTSTVIEFLSPEANRRQTHLTLILGANGTSKSRVLASLVERICQIRSEWHDDLTPRRGGDANQHGLRCTKVVTTLNGEVSENQPEHQPNGRNAPLALPSRILVLSNLVMDKFHFPKDNLDDQPFYNYLGVRQSTNLTTTGAAERSVAEAVLSMASDNERLQAFRAWTDLVFDNGRELAFAFFRLRKTEISRVLNASDRRSAVMDRINRRGGSLRAPRFPPEAIEAIAEQTVALFEFLNSVIEVYEVPHVSPVSNSKVPVLRISTLSAQNRKHLTKLIPNFSAASKAGFSPWPTLCIESTPWLPFSQMSSGEQNILSVGAKLSAYAAPGCLVAIDEPEVSLNVAWQQQYIELIRKSLAQASGSHVLIATHSPHLIASAVSRESSVVLIQKNGRELSFTTMDANFEGWGSESVLYQVLGIPSASSFHLNRDLAIVLKHIQESGKDRKLISDFLRKISRLDYGGIEPIELVVKEIRAYRDALG